MGYIDLINSLSHQQRINWNSCVDMVKAKSKTIDTGDIKQVIYTKLVASRFMLFSLTRKMCYLEKKLNGSIKGNSLNDIEEAFIFYNLRK